MIKRNSQQRLSAKIVELENTTIRLERLLIANIVELENTMIKHNEQQNLIVNQIATLDHTLYLIKVGVLFARKVSGKIKMDSQIVSAVELVNTMIKRNAQQSLLANLIATPDRTLQLTKVRVSFARKNE